MSILMNENKKTLYKQIKCPPTIAIKYIDSPSPHYSIISLQKFNTGDVIFENTSLLFNTSEINSIRVYFEDMNKQNHTMGLDLIYHTVNRGNNIREYYHFDTFTNHSCNPNTEVNLITDTFYKVIARSNINIGDELTQDYYNFDTFLDSSEFNCNCGYEFCRKIIRG